MVPVMYKYIALLLTSTLIVSVNMLFGQVSAIGHISAEVVESVSATNNFHPVLILSNTEAQSLDFGKITINGPENSICDISVSQSEIFNNQAYHSLESQKDIVPVTNNNSKRDILFYAILEDQINHGEYNGSLTVIVSYN